MVVLMERLEKLETRMAEKDEEIIRLRGQVGPRPRGVFEPYADKTFQVCTCRQPSVEVPGEVSPF